MNSILSLLLLLCCVLMFFVKREHKLCILAIYLICLKGVSSPILPATISPIFTFFVSEIIHFNQYWKGLKANGLLWPLIILLVSIVVLFFTSPHLVGLKGLWTAFNNGLFRNYIVLFLVFIVSAYGKLVSLKSLAKTCLVCMSVLTAFGIVNLITRHAIFIDWIVAGNSSFDAFDMSGSYYTDSDRFRVQAMFPNPFDYGYICLMVLVLFEYFRRRNIISKIQYYFILCCCLFGIFSCGARTLLAVTIVGGFVYLLFGFKLKRQVSILVLGGLIFVLLMMFVPGISEKLSFLATAFSDDSNVSGSSLSMRQVQLAAVLYQIRDHLLFGRGLNYFAIDMGWSQGVSGLVDKNLFGIEGVYLAYLLERGVFGLAMYALYWLAIIKVVIKSYKLTKNRLMMAINLSVIAAYLCFANMTGELGSVPPTSFIIGLTLGISLYSNRTNNYNRKVLNS